MESGGQNSDSYTSFLESSNPAFMAAIDGEADETTLEYLRTHPEHAHEIELMCDLQNRLRARLYRLFCPSSDMLRDYRLGLLTDEQHQVIAEHVALCPHCAAELGLLITCS
jgi:hypothetical protein